MIASLLCVQPIMQHVSDFVISPSESRTNKHKTLGMTAIPAAAVHP
jgi:hypothetical protein